MIGFDIDEIINPWAPNATYVVFRAVFLANFCPLPVAFRT